MAYADALRAPSATLAIAAALIEGIFTSLFPLTWGSWTPSYSASGSMTYGTITTSFAKYIQIGKLVLWCHYSTGTVGGTPARLLAHSLPVTGATGAPGGAAGYVADGGNQLSGAVITGTTSASYTMRDASNFSAGSGRVLAGFGIYEAA